MSEQVLPFYLVCDESYSMTTADPATGRSPIDDINAQIPTIYQEIASNPIVADRARLGIIGFSSTAEVLQPLADLNDVQTLPQISGRSATSYAAAFDLLRRTIDDDVRALKQAGHVPYRPTVFFLTDGLPTDPADWPRAHQRLTDPGFRARPHILAFGFGGLDAANEADTKVLRQIATFRAFVAKSDISPSEALSEFAKQLLNSIVQSAVASASKADGGATLSFPQQAAGYATLDAEPV
ncbi:vWA domain-containing protein [Actinomadura parmotrematis]|uniref:VWA domain-containing protein n=1 Tax=Actinomadura parmotrematis TaxID=2864039 RepID=A0ABS7G119_9ACTN|nr:VWA domain-containing protein [Actinomadura parmotrematis]MBW8485532.1 VWA domain-containing protein [Actinomadura parmotrematis]